MIVFPLSLIRPRAYRAAMNHTISNTECLRNTKRKIFSAALHRIHKRPPNGRTTYILATTDTGRSIERNCDIFGLFWLLQPIFYQSYQIYQIYQIFQTSNKTG